MGEEGADLLAGDDGTFQDVLPLGLLAPLCLLCGWKVDGLLEGLLGGV